MMVRRFMKFAVVGVIATVTHTSVFSVCIELLHIEPVRANAMAFVVAVLVGYALNRSWTFAEHGGADAKLWRYMAGALEIGRAHV